MIGTCHALAADGAVVKQYWPEYHRPSDADVPDASAPDTGTLEPIQFIPVHSQLR
jgi:hypothetical protein